MRSWLKTFGLIAFGGYVVWNAAWLFYGHIPPSIFVYLTGLPSPTTGMTRSLISLYEGDLKGFYLFNPFTSIYLALTGVSAVILARQRIRRKALVLPQVLVWSWYFAITAGWLLKFVVGNQYW